MRRRHTFLLFHFQKEKAENNLKIKNLNFIFFFLLPPWPGNDRTEAARTKGNGSQQQIGGMWR
jgi:hypothetical protein